MADNRNSRNEKHLGLSPDPSRPQPAEAMLLEGDEKSSEVEKYRDNPSPVPFHGEAWKSHLTPITIPKNLYLIKKLTTYQEMLRLTSPHGAPLVLLWNVLKVVLGLQLVVSHSIG